MTSKYRKKLIEVALPLKAINEASAREKSIRHGHPSTLHLWWARRPLAACRAVLFSSLVDDPDSDPAFAGDEERAATKRAQLFDLIEELVQWENSNNEEVIRSARAEIARSVASNLVEQGTLTKDHKLSGGTAVGELIRNGHCMPYAAVEGNGRAKKGKTIEGAKRFRFATAHLPPTEAVNDFLANHAPPVLDPFCGGGSIPLEAQRLGLRAYASDLNPVPVLITKALIEIPPRFAGMPPVNPQSRKDFGLPILDFGLEDEVKPNNPKSKIQNLKSFPGAAGLAADVRYYGKWMRDEAEKRIGHLYPKVKVTKEMAKDRPDVKDYVGEELTVIAWLWARTIQCPNPSCRARAPLVRSFWLSKKKGKECYAKPILDKSKKSVRFAIETRGEPPVHTTDRNGARCLFCETFIKKGPLRQIASEHGVDGIPLAIVAEGTRGRVYLEGDAVPMPTVTKSSVPFLEQPITNDRRWFSPPLYGMPNFADLFTPRQLVALTTFSDLVQEARERVLADARQAWTDGNPKSAIQNPKSADLPLADGGTGPTAYADAVATYLAFAVDRVVDRHSTVCTWDSSPSKLQLRNTFARQALPMSWDFAEGNPFCMSSGTWTPSVDWVAKVVEYTPAGIDGVVNQLDATAYLNSDLSPLVSTDPPYYDNIGYADLSDFFYVWLRRSLGQGDCTISYYPSRTCSR